MPWSLLSNPSIRKLLARGRRPLAEKPEPLVKLSRFSTETAPGCVSTRSIGFSELMGSFAISAALIVLLRSPLSVWSWAAAASTETVCSVAPTSSVTFWEVTTEACTFTPLTSLRLKPGAVTEIV